MKLIVFRRKDGKVGRMELAEKYLERGKSMQDIEEAVKKYNLQCHGSKPDEEDGITLVKCELRDVHEDEKDLFNGLVDDPDILFVDTLMHPSGEEVPVNTYIYVFRKHPNHDMPKVEIMKFCHNGIKLPEIRFEDNCLPLAWCKATELCAHLGLTRSVVHSLHKTAKALAWGWYKEESANE